MGNTSRPKVRPFVSDTTARTLTPRQQRMYDKGKKEVAIDWSFDPPWNTVPAPKKKSKKGK